MCIGLDVGGTGARGVLAVDGRVRACSRVDMASRVGTGGIDADNAVATLVPLVTELLHETGVSTVDSVAAGLTGFAMLGADLRVRLPAALGEAGGARTVGLCSDMLTSWAGALGLAGGAVVAAGTGAVALGTDLAGTWRRVDGWGYLIGDVGGGSWLGRAALQAALRADDGRPGGSPALLAALRERFGTPADLVRELATRADRAGVMAGFVPAVAAAAADGDPVATALLAEAGTQLAQTALAALPDGAPRTVAPTGNLFQAGDALWTAFTATVDADATRISPRGTAVDGAALLAAAALDGTVPAAAPLELYPAA
ncbi:BadF/BadG/BcrA/BcrD ATPase family protein [Hamadaea tsunoensis]|uniref:BadF/BadG/BcrA/BcrD ATPase family protein n=1 Tax=Hamadaea tsunoensis TaxID=53368 RepID=UPI0007E8C6B9|nr:BadF/BadG/BcrA/BcrD ATPase family protein [Hamadaea tsunoensis]